MRERNEKNMSAEGLHYYFACHFLWCALSLYHYLDEKVLKGRIDLPRLKPSAPLWSLDEWASEERFFPLDKEQVAKEKKEALFSQADRLGDILIFRLGDLLSMAAENACKDDPSTSEAKWLYYFYCRLIRQVLAEFECTLQESDDSSIYNKRYKKSITLFNDLAIALDRERPSLEYEGGIDQMTREKLLADLDAEAVRLGQEWRRAVLCAARDA